MIRKNGFKRWKPRCNSAGLDPEVPKVFKRNMNRLPVPRLELRCHNNGDWTHCTWVHGLFFKHHDGHYLLLPMWMTKVSSRSGKPVREGRPVPPRNAEKLIKYDMQHFGLPGFVIVDDAVKEFSPEPTSKRR